MAQTLCDELLPLDKLNSNLLEQFDTCMLDELAAGSYNLQHPDNTMICEDNAAGCYLHPFSLPATMNFDSALHLLQCSSGSDSCLIANVMPALPIAIPGLSDSSMEEDLPLVVQGAVTDALHTCVAQVVQNLCMPVLHEQECALIEFAEFFFNFQLSPLKIAKIELLSDEEIAKLETEVFSSGDIKTPQLNPIPSLPISNSTVADHTCPPGKAAITQALMPILEDNKHCVLINTALNEYLQHAVQDAFLLALAPGKDERSCACESYGMGATDMILVQASKDCASAIPSASAFCGVLDTASGHGPEPTSAVKVPDPNPAQPMLVEPGGACGVGAVVANRLQAAGDVLMMDMPNPSGALLANTNDVSIIDSVCAPDDVSGMLNPKPDTLKFNS